MGWSDTAPKQPSRQKGLLSWESVAGGLEPDGLCYDPATPPLSPWSGGVQLPEWLLRVWPGRVRHSQSPRINGLNLNTGFTLLLVHNCPKPENAFIDP